MLSPDKTKTKTKTRKCKTMTPKKKIAARPDLTLLSIKTDSGGTKSGDGLLIFKTRQGSVVLCFDVVCCFSCTYCVVFVLSVGCVGCVVVCWLISPSFIK
jgi:hypothetical protein